MRGCGRGIRVRGEEDRGRWEKKVMRERRRGGVRRG